MKFAKSLGNCRHRLAYQFNGYVQAHLWLVRSPHCFPKVWDFTTDCHVASYEIWTKWCWSMYLHRNPPINGLGNCIGKHKNAPRFASGIFWSCYSGCRCGQRFFPFLKWPFEVGLTRRVACSPGDTDPDRNDSWYDIGSIDETADENSRIDTIVS